MDKYKIDSHKLIYHVGRVSEWLEGKEIYPIYAEISPSGACNHRCVFCGLDFMEYKSRFLETDLLKKRLSEMADLGLKSIMFGGEGEPLLHKNIDSLTVHAKSEGIDVAFTTNGVLLNKKIVDNALESITWIKISIGGATEETYSKIHRTKPDDLKRVFKNLSYAVEVKEKKGYKTTLGMQLILLPENWAEAIQLARKAKEIGMNYLVIKPYSQHPLSKTKAYQEIRYSDYLYLSDELKKLNDENFNVIFRMHTMKKWDEAQHKYEKCLALPFWSYIDAGGDVWGCSCYLGDNKFYYGNIYENTFAEIWKGEQRKKSLDWTNTVLDVSKCRVNCRMDEINRYLWGLKNPPEHVNFI